MTGAIPGVLVLGGAGRIGRLLRYRWGPEAALWQSRQAQTGAGWVAFDPLTEPDAFQAAAEGQSVLLCLAGPVPGSPSHGAATGAAADLADHTRLAEACLKTAAGVGARVILASSAAVYGPAVCAREDQPLAPVNPYGQAKAQMEARAADLGAALGVQVTALRIGNIAGLDAALGGWRPGFRLDQFADGSTPKRSYIGAISLADVLADLIALPALPALPPALNIAQDPPVEMGALLAAGGHDFATAPAPQSALPEVALDLCRLKSFVHLNPATPEGLVAEWAALEPHLEGPPPA